MHCKLHVFFFFFFSAYDIEEDFETSESDGAFAVDTVEWIERIGDTCITLYRCLLFIEEGTSHPDVMGRLLQHT